MASDVVPLYISTSYILRFYDARRLLEVMSDTGTSETLTTYQTNEAYLEAVRSSEAELDEMLQVGGHYTQADLLAACVAADGADAVLPALTATEKEILRRRVAPIREMLAHLIFGKLMMRRGYSADRMRELAPMYEQALERLERIASGQRVLDFTAQIAAGIPQSVGFGSGTSCGLNNNPLFGIFPGCCGYPGYSGNCYHAAYT